MHWIDTHAHLYLDQFENDQAEVIDRALQEGVKQILLPNIDLDSFSKMMNLCSSYPQVIYPMIGLHPCDVKENWMEVLSKLEAQFQSSMFVAVGETGIDLYWDKSTFEIQKQAFIMQIKWAKKWNLPIVIHARESTPEILDILDHHIDDTLCGIFHCFSGTWEDACRIMEYKNFKMGIGGSVTYKNSSLPEILKRVPLSFIVLETDSPFLPPVPHRGKRNESSFIPIIGDFVSSIYALPKNQIAQITTANAQEIFKLP